MTTLPNTGMTLPVRGAPGAGQWGDTLDANLQIIDAMDHTPGHGPRIPTAGIGINADLSFSSLYAPKDLHRVQFSEIAAGALTNANNFSLFVSDGTAGLTAGELYWRNSTGNAVKITAVNSLNVGAFVGGIGGDYQSVGAKLDYDDSNKRYTFKEGTLESNGWARIAAGALRLIEFGTTETFYVEQLAPAALAGNYAVTWPTALPGSQLLAQIDNTGQIIWSNTVPGAVTFSAGITLAANQSINLSGTGDIKHGTRTLQLGHTLWQNANGATLTYTGGTAVVASGGTMGIECAIPLKAGDRITAIRFTGSDSATGPTKFQGNFGPYAGAAAGSTAVSAGSGATQTLAITSGLPVTLAAGTPYWMNFATTTGTNNTQFRFVEIDYDRP